MKLITRHGLLQIAPEPSGALFVSSRQTAAYVAISYVVHMGNIQSETTALS